MTWSCTIPGTPVAKGRPRFAGAKLGRAQVYTPQRTRNWEQMAAEVMRAQWRRESLEGPVALAIVMLLHRPRRLMRASDPDGRIYAPVRPDMTNIEKAIEDAMQNAMVLRDDALVVEKTSVKLYHAKNEGPGVEVQVCEVPERVSGK